MSFGHSNLVPMLTVSSYVNAAIGIVLMSALFFEIPALMLNLSLWGWVKSATWSKARRHSVVVNAMVSAFLSPPDPWSMLLMMLPLQILFECGILLAKMGEKISNRGQQA
jgi:sec-independent protein translocase protein TatC